MILRIFITTAKLAALVLIAFMAWLQLPELTYDFGSKTPIEINNPSDLDPTRITGTRFVVVRGTPDFSRAFVYRRYGLDHHYFTVKPYGLRLVVRTYDKITDEWKDFTSFVGRLRPFDSQPFSRYISAIYYERFEAKVPGDAYFLALDDVPKPSGWQVGGFILAAVIWLGLFWVFFLRKGVLRGLIAGPR